MSDQLIEQIGQLTARVSRTAREFEELGRFIDNAGKAIEDAVAAIGELQDNVSSGLAGCRSVLADIEGWLDSLVTDQEGVLEAFLDDVTRFSKDSVDEVMEAGERAADMITSDVLEPIADLQKEFADSIIAFVQDWVEDRLPSQMDTVSVELLEDLKGSLDTMVSELSERLDEFRDAIFGRADGSKGTRDASAEMRELLEQLLAPVMEALERVMGLGRLVGIPI